MNINLQLELSEIPAVYQALVSAGHSAMDEAKAERGHEASWRCVRDEADSTKGRTNAEAEILMAKRNAEAAELRAERYLTLATRARAVALTVGVKVEM